MTSWAGRGKLVNSAEYTIIYQLHMVLLNEKNELHFGQLLFTFSWTLKLKFSG